MELPRPFWYSIRNEDPIVLVVQGDVDLASAPKLSAALGQLLDEGHRYVAVDLAAVEFMDSTAVHCLVFSLERLREAGGDFVLRAASAPAQKVLELAGFERILPLAANDGTGRNARRDV
jgi:anti-anti-sigma factor